MKYTEKLKSIELRKTGMAINKIANNMGVSKSTVSIWVRDVKLTKEQEEKLKEANPRFSSQRKGAESMKLKYLNIRKKYQEEGKLMAKNASELFIKGCMLYWAEGCKDRASLEFANTDLLMIKLFKEFLDKEFKILPSEYRLWIQVHPSDSLSIIEIENYWLKNLNLDRGNLGKTYIVKNHPRSKNYKKNKHLYGVCKIYLGRVDVVQKIFGAIKFFTNIKDDKWLN